MSLPSINDEQQRIIKQIRLKGPLSRNELADVLNVSRSTINKHLVTLMDYEIVQVASIGDSSGGRRPQLTSLNPTYVHVVGIHMGATGATIGIANFAGEIIGTHRQSFQIRNQPEYVMNSIFEQVFKLLDKHNIKKEQIQAVGIGIPAPIDKFSEHVVNPAIMLGWDDYSPAQYCMRHFPDVIVKVDNDASLMALGELRGGHGRDHRDFIFIKIGTGIGCGIITNGEVYKGHQGYSGHIGHISVDRNGPVCYCGNVGCLEKIVGAPAITEQAMQAVQRGESPILEALMHHRGGYLQAEDVGTAATAGDRVANEIIITCGQKIGEVLATVVSFFNPSVAIIGGGISEIGPQLITSMHRTILQLSLPLSTKHFHIRKSEMGYSAGIVGAVSMALDHVFDMDTIPKSNL